MQSNFIKVSTLVLSLLTWTGCGLTQGTSDDESSSLSWSFAKAGGESTLNKSATQEGTKPALVVFNSKLYAAWTESNGSKTQIRVKTSSDGTTWSFADGGGTNGLNVSTSEDATTPSFAASTSKIYLAWSEDDGTTTPQIRVKESSDGSTWTSIESGGINVSTSQSALDVKLVYFNNKLYAVWSETDSGDSQIRVKRFDGGTTWTSVDGGPLNKVSATTAYNPYPLVYNNKLYVAWDEPDPVNGNTQIRVKSTSDGTTWASADGDAVFGLNVDYTKSAAGPSLIEFDSKMFLAFSETNGSKYQLRVRYFDGSDWTAIDGNGSTGINVSSDQDAYVPSFAVYNSKLFLFWQETNGTASQIRVKQYGGGVTWNSADGGGSTGLNSVSTQNAFFSTVSVFASKIYVIWQEQFSQTNIMIKAGS